jgi:hypothetical protein
VSWQGATIKTTMRINPIRTPLAGGSNVGTLTTQTSPLYTSSTVKLIMQKSAPKPSAWWRLTHPLST